MLQTAQQPGSRGSALNQLLSKLLPAKAGVDLLCADFAELPLGHLSVDLLWSNLALHWHPQPDRVFAEWRRVLRVNGLLMFSCFGPDSLRELRAAFAEADLAEHTLPFVDMHDFGDQLVEAGFATPCWIWKPSPSPTTRRKPCWPMYVRSVATRWPPCRVA
jgi:malonyl-CoA O-methyltransferase